MEPGPTTLRPPEADDWPMIAELADVAVAHIDGAPRQHGWSENRRSFEGERVHVVAERRGVVVGYGALERRPEEPPGAFRLFVVTSWIDSPEVADTLYPCLEAELSRRGAQRVWMRELAADEKLIDFAHDRGFESADPYDLDGMTLVNLTKLLEARSSA